MVERDVAGAAAGATGAAEPHAKALAGHAQPTGGAEGAEAAAAADALRHDAVREGSLGQHIAAGIQADAAAVAAGAGSPAHGEGEGEGRARPGRGGKAANAAAAADALGKQADRLLAMSDDEIPVIIERDRAAGAAGHALAAQGNGGRAAI